MADIKKHYHATLYMSEEMYTQLKRIANSTGWEIEVEFTNLELSTAAEDAVKGLLIEILGRLNDNNADYFKFKKLS
jgi:hypothetical protein